MILNLFITTLAIIAASYVLPGIHIKTKWTAVWVAILLAIINSTIGAILQFLATPLNWLTFGLVGFIINVLMILLVDKLVPGFSVKNFWWGILLAIFIAIVSDILHWLL